MRMESALPNVEIVDGKRLFAASDSSVSFALLKISCQVGTENGKLS